MLNDEPQVGAQPTVEPPPPYRVSGLGTGHFDFDPEGIEQELVQSLTALRTQKEMSQNELARHAQDWGLAFHQPTIQRIETGKRPLRVHEADILARILGASLVDLLTSEMSADTASRLYYDELLRALHDIRGAEERLAREQRGLEMQLESLADAKANYDQACATTDTPQRSDYVELHRRFRPVLESMASDISEARRALRLYASTVKDVDLRPAIVVDAEDPETSYDAVDP